MPSGWRSRCEWTAQLDEALYTSATPISDFIQAEPVAGQPATERTEVWISYDRDNVYVSLRAFESQPDRMIVNEMRRDGGGIGQNESFGFSLDTFYDRRNSVNFNFNAIGGRVGRPEHERRQLER